jgi:wobble nucleotide-excising tRNase
MNCNDEDLLDIITKQRLTIYHQERRIEALEKSLSQATQPTMTNDLVNQLFNQLQTSNELMALKAKCERLTEENERLRKAGDALAILQCAESDEQHKRRCVKNWLDVKEGKPSV